MKVRILLLACTVLLLVVASVVARQQTPAPTAAAAARFGFNEVSDWITKSADMVPGEKYAYKPVATVRSFGEIVAHVADSYAWYCGSATAKTDTAWADTIEKGKTDKATLVAALKRATAGCAAAYDAPAARIDKLMANVAHTNLHYGNLITYLRMLGLKPPSS